MSPRPWTLCTLALGGLLAAGCTRSPEPRAAAAEPEGDRPDQESWDATLQLATDGAVQIELSAPHVARYERPDSTFAVFERLPPAQRAPSDTARVRVRLFRDGRPAATLVANRVVFHDAERRLVAEGAVVVSAPPRRLDTERLRWSSADRTIRTDGLFRLVSPDERISGYGLRADESLETYSFSQLRGTIEVDE